MKLKTTIAFAAATFILGVSIYFFDIKKESIERQQKEISTRIINFEKDQVNFIEIQKGDTKYVLQKNQDGWMLLEPLQDPADNDQIESLLEVLTSEKYLAVAQESTDPAGLKLSEFGLDKAYASFNLKNNLGQSKRIFVGSQKNFEGNSFLRLNSENRVLVASPLWMTKSDQNLITYREKRLYRGKLAAIENVKIQSLQDKFELKRVENKWVSPLYPDVILDQNKVRDAIKRIAETSIIDYVIDGEPSKATLTEKKLLMAPVKIQFETAGTSWSVAINQSEKENAVFALSERPTNLTKLDPSKWELFGNLALDSLRDRTTLMRFNISEIKKIFYKVENHEYNFIKAADEWKSAQSGPENTEFSSIELVKILNHIHDLEISEFLDLDLKKQVHQSFSGKNMIILSSESGNLIFQLNWGPDQKIKLHGTEKDYYLARTNQSPVIFALEKAKLHTIDLGQVFKKKEPLTNEPKQ